jgi:hypothetical protein
MFQLYKNRSFGEYVSETFDFLRADGKHFFTQFFTILGVPILIMAVAGYFFQSYSNSYNRRLYGANPNQFENLAIDSLGLIGFAIAFIIFIFVFFVIINSFTVIYLKLYQINLGSNFKTTDILNEYKNSFGNIIIFNILMFLTSIVVFLIALIPLVILIITIIGIIPAFFLMIGFILFSILSLYIYLNNREIGYLEVLGLSFNHIKNNFWPTLGSFFIMYLIYFIIAGFFSVISQGFEFTNQLIFLETGVYPEEEEFSYKTILGVILLILSQFVTSFILSLNNITAGLIYYSMQDHKENINVKSDIDLIGTQEVD